MNRRDRDQVDYQALKLRSGWYAAAWRDYRKLTLQELADRIGSSRGQISDLETGAKTRFNRDWVRKFSEALEVQPGFLLDVNPFDKWKDEELFVSTIRRLEPDSRSAILDMALRLLPKSGR